MACRFPGARNLDEFWDLIASGGNAFTRLDAGQVDPAGVGPHVRSDPSYVPVAGILDDVEMFDAEFFGIGPRDAALMDPQHRHFLEVCWEALEDAGHVPSRFDGSIGVYAGSGMNGYLVNNLLPNRDLVDPLGIFAVRHTANDKDFLSTGVSYRLDLRGPSVNVQTACSTSLVSLHLAAQALIGGECDMALAGGVTIEVPHGQGYLYREGEILARDGVCRAFDAASSGTVLTSGAGVVVLRRLSDALTSGDHVYAVVKATAINNDGAGKVGYLAPSVDGHAAVVAEAQDLAGITADTIQYVEAHGTGTPVGDPIEVAALTQAFRRTTDKTGFARLGSTKPSIGHLDTAAGVASVIKTSLALSKRTLPPMANYTAPNPLLDLESTPFLISPEPAPWPEIASPRRAGVSSLGVGGTNAHAILQEAPPRTEDPDEDDRYEILTLSARTPAALDRAKESLARHLERHPEVRLADVALTLQAGREQFVCRAAVAARTVPEAVDRLRRPASASIAATAPSAVFMFPGVTSQYPNMGRELFETQPVYRAAVEECFRSMDPALAGAVRELLYPRPGFEESAAEQLSLPSFQLPAIFITEYALAQLWLSWGIRPAALTGHSLGEYTAACLAGVFRLKDALSVVALRGRLMERATDAAVLTVALPEGRVRELITPGVSVAAVNAPELCVVSGPVRPIEALESTLSAGAIPNRRLRIRGAVHCGLLDPYLEEFARGFKDVRLSPPAIPCISNLTGDWARPEEVATVDYWVRHLRYTVRFAEGLEALLAGGDRIMIELGPGNTLTTLSRQQSARPHAAIAALPHPSERRRADDAAFAALGQAWAAGLPVDFAPVRSPDARRVSLPPYQFERTRHWFDAPKTSRSSEVDRLEPDEWLFRPSWRRADLLGAVPNIDETDTWLVVGSGKLAQSAVAELRVLGADVVAVRQGPAFKRNSAWSYESAVATREGWFPVTAQLTNFRQMVAGIIWTPPLDSPESLDAAFFGPVALLQELAAAGHRPKSLTIVTSGTYSVDGEVVRAPAGALAEGPVRVAPAELESLVARVVDVGPGAVASHARLVVAEALLGNEAVVALRDGHRWVRSTEQIAPAASRGSWMWGRSVLITGGLGGIGLSLARHLAETQPGICLTLTSRSGLPAPGEMPPLPSRPTALHEVQQTVAALELLGAQVLIVAADVADAAAVRDALDRARSAFGRVDTVVHAAGIVDDAPLVTRNRDEMAAVLRPKVEGSKVVIAAARSAGVGTVVLCSSVSAEVGLPGQVDYAAANAYLNALAMATRPDTTRVVSIPFGRWDQVGMAATPRDAADGLPFLGKKTQSGTMVRFDSTKLVEDLWVLDGHRLQSGVSLMPGTGYLQAFVSAARTATGQRAVALEDVEFREALAAQNGRAVTFATRLVDGELTVRSRQATHASARLSTHVSPSSKPQAVDWSSQPFGAAGRTSFQDGHLVFGPRWKVLRAIERRGATTFASVALDEAFVGDLSEYDLHPALLDIALSCGVPGEFVAGNSVVAPVRCDRFEAIHPLPARARVISRQVQSPDPAELRFDVTILDGDGTLELARASGMVYRRLDGDSVDRISVSAARRPKPLVPIGMGLTPAEAWPVVGKALAAAIPVVGLSSVAMEPLAASALRARTVAAPGALLARPALATPVEEPRDETETALARIWSECLGVDGLGVHDDFFELGGHSLIALRLIARVQAEFGAKWLLANVQDCPTIASQAGLLRGSGVAAGLPNQEAETASQESNLVVFRQHGEKPPFFCVHGMFGNVMNFTDLAAAMPDGRSFIAVQQHGLDGTPTPYRTIESMAAAYLEDVRRHQPHGPYALGGYSAGGCIALEMARQLVAAGETVEQVVMLDSWGPAMVGRDFRLRFSRLIRRLRFEGPKVISTRIRSALARVSPAPGGAIALRNVPGEKTVFANVELGNVVVEALHQYQFVPVEVPVTLVTATLRDPETRFLPADLGWKRFLPGISVTPVAVPHITMCTGTNAPHVARAIANALGD